MGKAKNLLFTACLEHFGQIRPDSHIWLFSSTDTVITIIIPVIFLNT